MSVTDPFSDLSRIRNSYEFHFLGLGVHGCVCVCVCVHTPVHMDIHDTYHASERQQGDSERGEGQQEEDTIVCFVATYSTEGTVARTSRQACRCNACTYMHMHCMHMHAHAIHAQTYRLDRRQGHGRLVKRYLRCRSVRPLSSCAQPLRCGRRAPGCPALCAHLFMCACMRDYVCVCMCTRMYVCL